MRRRTRGWSLVRLELAIAVGAFAVWTFATPALQMFVRDHRVEWLGLSAGFMLILASGVSLVVGLASMVRIAGTSTEEPAQWRYRDR